MADRFFGDIQIGGRVTREQFKALCAIVDPLLELHGEIEADGSANFYECTTEDFTELIAYCKANNIALAIQWDAKWEYNSQIEYYIGDSYKQFETDSEGRIVVQVEDLEKHRASMTINEFIASLDIPEFPEFSIAEDTRTISTGEPSTLATYRRMASVLMGENAPATKMLDEKIEQQGADMEVIQDEGQMLYLIVSMGPEAND